MKQTLKLKNTGSLMNWMMGNNQTLPEVGKGATKLMYSDRHPYEVIEVSKDYKTVKLERLDHEWDKTKAGGEGHQNWILKPTGSYLTIVWKWGGWKVKGSEIVFTDEYIKDCESKGIVCIAAWLSKNNPELAEKISSGLGRLTNVVEGITIKKDTYTKINIIFGHAEYYYDWEF